MFAGQGFAAKFQDDSMRLQSAASAPHMLNLIIACILAAVLGFAAHRASICTVRAVAEFTHSGTGYMFASIVKSALWVFAITVPVFLLLPQTATGLAGWQLTLTAMFGGLLFGIGAGVNGACAYATMARMVDGEIGMLLTVFGFVLGVLIFVALLGTGTIVRPAPAPSQIPGVVATAPYIVVVLLMLVVYEFVRIWRSREAGSKLSALVCAPAYRLSTAALLMGVAGGLIFLIFGSAGYTTTFQQVIEAHAGTRPMPAYGRWFVVGAVLFGMFASTWATRQLPDRLAAALVMASQYFRRHPDGARLRAAAGRQRCADPVRDSGPVAARAASLRRAPARHFCRAADHARGLQRRNARRLPQ
jgi:uncharacterized membrane protein YedE/YeeE